MSVKEHKSQKGYLYAYFLLSAVIGFVALVQSIHNPSSVSEFVNNEKSLSITGILIAPVLFILSILAIFIILRAKFSKKLLAYPLYFIFFFVFWLNVAPFIIIWPVLRPQDQALQILDAMTKIDPLFYFLQVVLASWAVYQISRK
ncbi:MAG: hypothetical protein AABY01_02325 [Nanoarchaeota archaeon]